MNVDPRFGTEDDPRWTTCQCQIPEPFALVTLGGIQRVVCACFMLVEPKPAKQDWSPREKAQ